MADVPTQVDMHAHVPTQVSIHLIEMYRENEIIFTQKEKSFIEI